MGLARKDPRTGRPIGDHGTANQAIEFALDSAHHDHDPGNQIAFLDGWREGSLDEWPDYYKWLTTQEAI